MRFAAEPRLTLVKGSFGRLEELVRAAGVEGGLDGVLFDLGVSSPQLDEARRGFSFMQDGPLDMRMDHEAGQSAAHGSRVRASARSPTCCARWARSASRGASRARSSPRAPSSRSSAPRQLAAIVAAAVPTREPGKHPATRTFQALRIHVNGELEALEAALPQAVRLLAPGGRLA